MMVYLAAEEPLRLIAWNEDAPTFYVSKLSSDEARVGCQFQAHNWCYAGSHEGCSCGFQYGEYPQQQYEPGEIEQRRSSLNRFAQYLRDELTRVGRIEVFACWDGDQELEPEHHRVLTPSALEQNDFFFRKREYSSFVPDGLGEQ
jgi:hypothetical protein